MDEKKIEVYDARDPIERKLSEHEKRISELEKVVKEKTSDAHRWFPDIFDFSGYCIKCRNPPYLRKGCKSCESYKEKWMKKAGYR